MENITKVTKSTAVLTIKKVSGRDFQTTFTCTVMNSCNATSKNVTLRQRGERRLPGLLSFATAASLMPPFLLTEIYFRLDVENMSILFSCLLAAVLLKCFFIDIVLLVRPCLSRIKRKTGETHWAATLLAPCIYVVETGESEERRFKVPDRLVSSETAQLLGFSHHSPLGGPHRASCVGCVAWGQRRTGSNSNSRDHWVQPRNEEHRLWTHSTWSLEGVGLQQQKATPVRTGERGYN